MAESVIKGMPVKIAKVYDQRVSLDTGKVNEIQFSFPSDYHKSLGVKMSKAWPTSTWANAIVGMINDNTMGNTPSVGLSTMQAQEYFIRLDLVYI